MTRQFKISLTNPFEDTVFAIRVAVNNNMVAAAKLERVDQIMEEFKRVMEERASMNLSSPKDFPRGDEDSPNLR